MNNLIDKEDSQKKFHEENPEYKEMYEQSKNSPLYKLRKKILHLRINKGLPNLSWQKWLIPNNQLFPG